MGFTLKRKNMLLLELSYLFGYKTGVFRFCRMTTSNYTSPINLCYNTILTFLNNPKDLDPSYKMDLDIWNVLEGKKIHLKAEEIR